MTDYPDTLKKWDGAATEYCVYKKISGPHKQNEIVKHTPNSAIAGYAMACCDIYREGGEDYAEEALEATGHSVQNFIDAGLDDERDIELLNLILGEKV